MSKTTRLNRRHFLKGIAVTLTLPSLESLAARVSEPQAPRRHVCVGIHLVTVPEHRGHV